MISFPDVLCLFEYNHDYMYMYIFDKCAHLAINFYLWRIKLSIVWVTGGIRQIQKKFKLMDPPPFLDLPLSSTDLNTFLLPLNECFNLLSIQICDMWHYALADPTGGRELRGFVHSFCYFGVVFFSFEHLVVPFFNLFITFLKLYKGTMMFRGRNPPPPPF